MAYVFFANEAWHIQNFYENEAFTFFVVHALVALALNLAVNQPANGGTFFRPAH